MDDIKNRTDEGGKFSLVTNNSDSRDDDEYDEVGIEVKTPLFLQMEMQVWASLPNPSDIVNGHQIPLRRVFILGFFTPGSNWTVIVHSEISNSPLSCTFH